MNTLSPALLPYLAQLKANNHKEWFLANKPTYEQERNLFKQFAHTVFQGMQAFDQLEDLNIFRIYRDVRFSRNKTPYKTHFSFSMSRATRLRRGGYYLHIEPGGSFIGGGFWAPEPADLRHIRKELAADPHSLRTILADPTFIDLFGTMQGEQLKGVPQGYAKEHPAADLLRFKQYLVIRNFSDEEVLQSSFFEEAQRTFLGMHPFFNYMSEVLSTDENGEPLWE